MASVVAVLFSVVLSTYLFLSALLHFTQSEAEPIAIDTSIPFISPIVGLWRRGSHYWLGPQSRAPIYTLRFPWFRLYLVNSTRLIPLVQKKTQSISFTPVIVTMAATIMDSSKHALQIISREPLEDHGHISGVSKVVHATLSPGMRLDALNRKAVQVITASLDRFALKISEDETRGHTTLKMCRWIGQHMMMATTGGFFGPLNPFRDPATVDAFRIFEKGILPLMTRPWPSITARRHVQAREILVQAFEKYYEAKGHEDPGTSAFIRERHHFFSNEGLSITDIARIEAITCIALLSNTMPATFWLVYHIVSNPAVLAEVRQELAGSQDIRKVQSHADGSESEVRFIDLDYIRTQCPILLSTYKEVFRVHGVGVSVRVIMEDCTLDDKFLLKQNNILLIPGVVQHQMQSVWGDNVDDFYYKRFLQAPQRSNRTNPVAFRGFGGGSTLCPGRQFATTAIMAFAALFVLRFKATPRGFSGQWSSPTVEKTISAASVHQPDTDVEIDVWLQDATEKNTRWEVKLSGSIKPMEISAEDMTIQ